MVCCRLNEYRWLPKRLKLNGAICIEPLSPEEVGKYLDTGGPKLAALRVAIDSDSVLQELAQTPLMLSIMSLTYQEAGSEDLTRQKGSSSGEHRKQIFGFYIEQMFRRKTTDSREFRKQEIIHWLSWLAGKMREHSQAVFLVEGLQPSWLGARVRSGAYENVIILVGGLLGGLLGWLLGGLGSFTLPYGTIIGRGLVLIIGQIGGLIHGLGWGLQFASRATTFDGFALVETLRTHIRRSTLSNFLTNPPS